MPTELLPQPGHPFSLVLLRACVWFASPCRRRAGLPARGPLAGCAEEGEFLAPSVLCPAEPALPQRLTPSVLAATAWTHCPRPRGEPPLWLSQLRATREGFPPSQCKSDGITGLRSPKQPRRSTSGRRELPPQGRGHPAGGRAPPCSGRWAVALSAGQVGLPPLPPLSLAEGDSQRKSTDRNKHRREQRPRSGCSVGGGCDGGNVFSLKSAFVRVYVSPER